MAQRLENWLKSAIINEYRQGENGYKSLARKYHISRDSVRSIVLRSSFKRYDTDIRLENEAPQMIFDTEDEKDREYYQTAAAYWKNYAKLLEAEIEKKNKKKLKIQAATQTINENPKMKMRKVCEVADISKSTYYFNYKNNKKEIEDMKVISLIEKLPKKMKKRAGSKTKSEKIKQQFGIVINHKKMARICKEYGLLAKNRAKKHPKDYYENKKEERKNLPKNILNREFKSSKPFEKLVTDVSYFKTQSGWLYFSPVMDLYSRKILCYSISKNNDINLVNDMLNKLDFFRINNGLIHSDQGVLYTSKEYRKRLKESGFVQSMSRKANCQG